MQANPGSLTPGSKLPASAPPPALNDSHIHRKKSNNGEGTNRKPTEKIWLRFNRLLQLHLICCPPSPKVVNIHTNNARATSISESPNPHQQRHHQSKVRAHASSSFVESVQECWCVQAEARDSRRSRQGAKTCNVMSDGVTTTRTQKKGRPSSHVELSLSQPLSEVLSPRKKRESLEKVSTLKHAESEISEAISLLQRVRNHLRKLHHHWSLQR